MDIFSVIRSNDLEGVSQWLKTGPDINKPDNYGWTPINRAPYNGRTGIVKLLLAQPRIEFNKPDYQGKTPINNASYSGYTEIVKLLLAQPGVDFNKPDYQGKTPINRASNSGYTEIVKLLLAQSGIDFNKPDYQGNTPINNASYCGYTDIIKLLLAQSGIEFNKPDYKGKTPIDYALYKAHTEIVHILEEYQKNPIKMRNIYLREYFPQIIEEYFILMVLYSDDYFICADEGEIRRFFTMVVILPQELQALIANIIVGSSSNIPKLLFVNEAIEKFLIKKLIFFLIESVITI
jgi:ankyrin repeat protein